MKYKTFVKQYILNFSSFMLTLINYLMENAMVASCTTVV